MATLKKDTLSPSGLAGGSAGLLGDVPPPRGGRISGIFHRRGLWAKLEFVFWRTLCPMPDQTRIGMWWYGVSGNIARYFHAKHCSRCKCRRP